MGLEGLGFLTKPHSFQVAPMCLCTRAPALLFQMAWNGPHQVFTEKPPRHKWQLYSLKD